MSKPSHSAGGQAAGMPLSADSRHADSRHRAARAEQEHKLLLAGAAVLVDEFDDHDGHMRIHDSLLRSELYQSLTEEEKDRLRRHIAAHAHMRQTMASASVRIAVPSPEEVLRQRRSQFWLRFKRNRFGLVGLALVTFLGLVAVVGPFVAPYDPIAQNPRAVLQGPSAAHWMGTDDIGRDIFSRILHAAHVSLAAGIGVVLVGLVTGVPLGAIAAYFRRADVIIMRLAETLLALTGLLFALALVAIMGPGFTSVLLGAGIAGMPSTILLTRSLVLALRNNDFVTAASCVGCTDFRILAMHILPNCMSPLVVQQTFRIAVGILTVASLSFLGLGVQPPTPEWGSMLSSGREYLYRAPHVSTFPGLALALTVLAFNLLGDAVRDALDPRYYGTRRT